MNYALDNYGDFANEQDMLADEAGRKEEKEHMKEIETREIEFRFKSISGYFVSMSWQHKKQFILSIIQRMNCFDTLLQIISYISTLFGKMAAYADDSPQCKAESLQIVIDHDRSLEYDCLKEAACEDLNWIAALTDKKQLALTMALLNIGGCGLMRKIYIPVVNIYNRKVSEHAQLKAENLLSHRELEDIFDDPEPDDSDKYPRAHPLSIEVEKLRKKWNEIIDKYRREVFPVEDKEKGKTITEEKPSKKNTDKSKKVKNEEGKTGGKSTGEAVDWIQMLPVYVVKKILDYFDTKTLQNLKKVNYYWSYVCDNLIKDRQGRQFLNDAIEKMISNVDPEVLKECRESEDMFKERGRRPDSPRTKRLKKLMNRGAVLDEMKPKVKKCSQERTDILTGIPRRPGFVDPIDKITVFPRLIKEDLLLYKEYPCILKDVNVLIDIEDNLKQRRKTLSYSLSKQLSDTFSLAEADLANW